MDTTAQQHYTLKQVKVTATEEKENTKGFIFFLPGNNMPKNAKELQDGSKTTTGQAAFASGLHRKTAHAPSAACPGQDRPRDWDFL